jgi:hypothetical protein
MNAEAVLHTQLSLVKNQDPLAPEPAERGAQVECTPWRTAHEHGLCYSVWPVVLLKALSLRSVSASKGASMPG